MNLSVLVTFIFKKKILFRKNDMFENVYFIQSKPNVKLYDTKYITNLDSNHRLKQPFELT